MNLVCCTVSFDLSDPDFHEVECLSCGSGSMRIFTGFFDTEGKPISYNEAFERNKQNNIPVGAVLVSSAHCGDCSAKFLALVCGNEGKYYDLVWPEVIFPESQT